MNAKRIKHKVKQIIFKINWTWLLIHFSFRLSKICIKQQQKEIKKRIAKKQIQSANFYGLFVRENAIADADKAVLFFFFFYSLVLLMLGALSFIYICLISMAIQIGKMPVSKCLHHFGVAIRGSLYRFCSLFDDWGGRGTIVGFFHSIQWAEKRVLFLQK